MSEELISIIEKFNNAQSKAVDVLEAEFNCPKPKDSMDYITRCVPAIREANYESGGYKIRPHGVGMEINLKGIKVDFDFGKNGEINGFDAWRLVHFINVNKIKTVLDTEEKINTAIKSAMKSGKIIKLDDTSNNYYVNS